MMFAIKHWDSCTFSHSPILGPFFPGETPTKIHPRRTKVSVFAEAPDAVHTATEKVASQAKQLLKAAAPYALASCADETSQPRDAGCWRSFWSENRDKPGYGIIPYGSLWIPDPNTSPEDTAGSMGNIFGMLPESMPFLIYERVTENDWWRLGIITMVGNTTWLYDHG